MRNTRSVSFSMLALAGVVALSACSGPGGGDELSYEDSPLSKYFEAINGEWDEDSFNREQQETEELVAACMAEEGFEYIPVDQSRGVMFSDDDWEERQTEEWVAANGWGIVQTQAEMEEQQARYEDEEWIDPNQDYVDALSPSEQEAYWATLHGEPMTEEMMDEDGSYEYSWETAGCYGAAQHEVQGDNFWDDEEFKPLMDKMNGMWEELAKRPESIELDAAWASCMADAGHGGIAKRQDASTAIMDEVNAIWEDHDGEGEPDYSGLDALKEKEIELALADFRCAKEVDYEAKQLKVQFAMEEQFIQDNKSELDALLAAYAQGS